MSQNTIHGIDGHRLERPQAALTYKARAGPTNYRGLTNYRVPRTYGIEGHRLEWVQPALTYEARAVHSNLGPRSGWKSLETRLIG